MEHALPQPRAVLVGVDARDARALALVEALLALTQAPVAAGALRVGHALTEPGGQRRGGGAGRDCQCAKDEINAVPLTLSVFRDDKNNCQCQQHGEWAHGAHMHIYTRGYTHTHTRTHTRVHARIHIYTHAHTHTHTHSDTSTHTHTHTHTQ